MLTMRPTTRQPHGTGTARTHTRAPHRTGPSSLHPRPCRGRQGLQLPGIPRLPATTRHHRHDPREGRPEEAPPKPRQSRRLYHLVSTARPTADATPSNAASTTSRGSAASPPDTTKPPPPTKQRSASPHSYSGQDLLKTDPSTQAAGGSPSALLPVPGVAGDMDADSRRGRLRDEGAPAAVLAGGQGLAEGTGERGGSGCGIGAITHPEWSSPAGPGVLRLRRGGRGTSGR